MRSYMIVCTKRFIMANNEPLGSTLKNCKGFAVVSKAGVGCLIHAIQQYMRVTAWWYQ